MSGEHDQRTELDDWLVVLRKVQRASPDEASIAKAKEVSRRIQVMIKKGVAMQAYLQIRQQLEARLGQLRSG